MAELIELKLHTMAGPATLTLEQQGRTYKVRDFSVQDRPELALAFSPNKTGVEDLDGRSDMAQCYGLSNKVRYGFVVLGSTEMRAHSREELEHALKYVKVSPFNPEEI